MERLAYTFSVELKQKKQYTDRFIITELKKIGLINTTDYILYKRVHYIINTHIELKFDNENEFHQIVKNYIEAQGETGVITL